MFTVTAEDGDHYSVLRVSGEVGLADAVEFTRQMQEQLTAHKAPQYLLDLNEVSRMDKAGLGVLVSLSTRLQGSGRRFVLLCPSPRVTALLTHAQIESFFPTCESEAELKRFGKNAAK